MWQIITKSNNSITAEIASAEIQGKSFMLMDQETMTGGLNIYLKAELAENTAQ